MAKVQDIKARIRSVGNTKKITRTMELVATAKAQVAGGRIERAIPYFEALNEIASEARGQGGVASHPLLNQSEDVKRVAILVIVGNRGLCGGYNSTVMRMARNHMQSLNDDGVETVLIPSGGKAFTWLKYQGIDFAEGYRQFEDKPQYVETEKVANRLIHMFLSGEVDRVDVCYTHFFSSGRQSPVTNTLLPLSTPTGAEEEQAVASDTDFIIEPDPASILNAIFPLQVKLDVFRSYLSSAASEQIARRIAMKNATENAEELSKNLKMLYNRLRQAQITTEILEIMGGSEALK
jgi:F-type H+-transporting ATPase subunit gamma